MLRGTYRTAPKSGSVPGTILSSETVALRADFKVDLSEMALGVRSALSRLVLKV
jgi:hypothetical protein